VEVERAVLMESQEGMDAAMKAAEELYTISGLDSINYGNLACLVTHLPFRSNIPVSATRRI
jgi:hypothetical protein